MRGQCLAAEDLAKLFALAVGNCTGRYRKVKSLYAQFLSLQSDFLKIRLIRSFTVGTIYDQGFYTAPRKLLQIITGDLPEMVRSSFIVW